MDLLLFFFTSLLHWQAAEKHSQNRNQPGNYCPRLNRQNLIDKKLGNGTQVAYPPYRKI